MGDMEQGCAKIPMKWERRPVACPGVDVGDRGIEKIKGANMEQRRVQVPI